MMAQFLELSPRHSTLFEHTHTAQVPQLHRLSGHYLHPKTTGGAIPCTTTEKQGDLRRAAVADHHGSRRLDLAQTPEVSIKTTDKQPLTDVLYSVSVPPCRAPADRCQASSAFCAASARSAATTAPRRLPSGCGFSPVCSPQWYRAGWQLTQRSVGRRCERNRSFKSKPQSRCRGQAMGVHSARSHGCAAHESALPLGGHSVSHAALPPTMYRAPLFLS